MPQNFPFFAAPYQKPCLVQALVLMFKGHPNYVSNMFSMKIGENNLIGSSSRLNQQAPNTSFKHKLSPLRAISGALFLLTLGRTVILRIH